MSDLLKEENRDELATAERTRGGVTYTPRFDIVETKEELLLYGDLAGVSSEDLDVRFENHELTIHARVTPRHADVQFVTSEYGVGDYFRAFRIGEEINAEKISAELSNGVLIVHLPKSEAVKPRRISVKTS